MRRKTENGLDVWFPQKVSIDGPPVDFRYVRNDSLRMTNNCFYWKNDAHQLIFLPLNLGQNLRKTTLFKKELMYGPLKRLEKGKKI